MSQRSAKMSRRIDAQDQRIAMLETRWDQAARYATKERTRTDHQFESLRNERHAASAERQKKINLNRFLFGILIGLAIATLVVFVSKVSATNHADAISVVENPVESVDFISDSTDICKGDSSEPVYFNCNLPFELQDDLRDACDKTGVDMALALSVIEKESNYKNVVGDSGDSYGYMQVQPRWHRDRMERLGVTDLMNPAQNFLVGCDFLAECLDKYPLASALSAYNSGRPNLVPYAEQVIDIYDDMWERLI